MDLGMSFLQPIAADQTMQLQRSEEARKQALAPAELAHTVGLARLATSQADKMDSDRKSQDLASAMMVQTMGQYKASGEQPPMSVQLQNIADIYSKAGSPNKAFDAMKASSEAAAHEAAARGEKYKEDAQRLTAAGMDAKMISSLLADVHDEGSWAKANENYKQLHQGKESPFAKFPYDPELVKMLQDAGETAAQRASQEQKAQDLNIKLARLNNELRHQAVTESISRERLSISQAREKRLSKSGGKDVGAPSPKDTEYAERLFGMDPSLSGLPDDERKIAAYDTAATARAIRKQNPGISNDEATRRALQQKKDAGDFEGAKQTPFDPKHPWDSAVAAWGNKPASYKAGGTAARLATPMDPPTAKAQLVVGQHYKDSDGTVKVWTGKKFELAKPGKMAGRRSAPTSSSSDSEDDEDD